jgi:outer membrane protein OmpA-like peptidoglycan-associated protein
MESFDGDTAPFEATRPTLEACLVSQYKLEPKKLSPALLCSIGVIALALFVWIGFLIHDHIKWLDLLTRLNSQEGIVVTKTEKQDGRYIVRGLRDELAVDPSILLEQAQMKPDQVSFQWTPYQALSESIVLKRVKQILNPPDTVSLSIKNGKLLAEGSAPHDWIMNAARLVQAMPGIKTFSTDKLIDSDLEKIGMFNKYVETLKREKGIVITSTENRKGEYHVSGFLDPLARNPTELLRATKIPTSKVIFHWEPYQSLDPFLIAERAKRQLNPPTTISIQVEDGCIVVTGEAPHRWIVELRRWMRTISGAPCLKEKRLVDLDVQELQTLKKEIEAENILFLTDTTNPVPSQSENIDNMAGDIRKAIDLAYQLEIPIYVKVQGHTDKIGPEERNKRLSQLRAEKVIDFLVSRGVPSHPLSTQAMAASRPITPENSEQDREKNRRVSFQVLLGQALN